MRWSSRQGDGQLKASSPGPEAYTTSVDVNSRSTDPAKCAALDRLCSVAAHFAAEQAACPRNRQECWIQHWVELDMTFDLC